MFLNKAKAVVFSGLLFLFLLFLSSNVFATHFVWDHCDGPGLVYSYKGNYAYGWLHPTIDKEDWIDSTLGGVGLDGPGIYKAELEAPLGADFDLYVYDKCGVQEVVKSSTFNMNEVVNFTVAKEGTYHFKALARSTGVLGEKYKLTITFVKSLVQSHSFSACFDDDVYWFNSVGVKETLRYECGSDSFSEVSKFCKGNDVFRNVSVTDKYCSTSTSSCSSKITSQEEFVQACSGGKYCSNGSCVPNTCTASTIKTDCGTNGLIGSNYCFDNDVYRDYISWACNGTGSSAKCSNTTNKVKQTECFDTSYGVWGSPFCKNNNLVMSRLVNEKGCSVGSCIAGTKTEIQVVESCSLGCDSATNSCISNEPNIKILDISAVKSGIQPEREQTFEVKVRNDGKTGTGYVGGAVRKPDGSFCNTEWKSFQIGAGAANEIILKWNVPENYEAGSYGLQSSSFKECHSGCEPVGNNSCFSDGCCSQVKNSLEEKALFQVITQCSNGVWDQAEGEEGIDCGGTCGQSCTAKYDGCIPLIKNGDEDDKIDIAFIPDSEYNNNLNNFREDVGTIYSDVVAERFPNDSEKFNFYYVTDNGHYNELCDFNIPNNYSQKCSFVDAGVVLHINKLRDCKSGSVFSSESGRTFETDLDEINDIYGTFIHELSHAIFELSDEYCAVNNETSYSIPSPFPNIWSAEQDCSDDATSNNWSEDCVRVCTQTTNNNNVNLVGHNIWRLNMISIMHTNGFDIPYSPAGELRVNHVLGQYS